MRELRGDGATGDARGAVVTIGVFDGVHRGHQAVIGRVVDDARAQGLAATVVTFDPHPLSVVAPERAPRTIESLGRRLDRFDRLGVDQVRVVEFSDDAAHESAESFVDRVLVEELAAKFVVVGGDFRFGHGRQGDVALLRQLGDAKGFRTEVVHDEGQPHRFSSSAVRTLLTVGDLEGAVAILGHPLAIDGTVERGDGRGQALGFPTANVAVPPDRVWPHLGIYAGAARTAAGEFFGAAISIGRRPQFYEDGAPLIEAHLLGFSADLYGQALTLVLLARLRDEAAFPTVDALRAQIDRDAAAARERFNAFAHDPDRLLGFDLGRRR